MVTRTLRSDRLVRAIIRSGEVLVSNRIRSETGMAQNSRRFGREVLIYLEFHA